MANAAPVVKPVAKPVAKPTVAPVSFPLKPGQLFIDKDKKVYAILKDDLFPTVPGYMLLKRYSPISNTLAVCDSSHLRFITPVGTYFVDSNFDFKVSGSTLWAYEWNAIGTPRIYNYTFIQSTPLVCAINNFPVKKVPVSSFSWMSGDGPTFFKFDSSFFYSPGQIYQTSYQTFNLSTGSVGTYTSYDLSMTYAGLRPIGFDGNKFYFTQKGNPQQIPHLGFIYSNFTIYLSNSVTIVTDFSDFPAMSATTNDMPATTIVSSKIYVWKRDKQLFSTYDATSGTFLGSYKPVSSISSQSAMRVTALASSADGKTLYILAERNGIPRFRFIVTCDTSSVTTPCKNNLIESSSSNGNELTGLAELKSGVVVAFIVDYSNGNYLAYYNIKV